MRNVFSSNGAVLVICSFWIMLPDMDCFGLHCQLQCSLAVFQRRVGRCVVAGLDSDSSVLLDRDDDRQDTAGY
ncbi:hypothetical protein XFUD_05585 [Xylella fastidiosa]|uniref:Uncharacterized protein n=1 Tax=Xylella fastidiosa (strain 9a5c) TaxID=160492 RepID=Q9PDQ4_XYLFA|nr:hypothetical protein XF_1325 [Xylella fastidiosa 9a5c]ALQ94713.1 hypothetical protein XFUD_05585 [Xylella fastidiosa]ETE31275.1 hypothetical protein B398_08235 [Xylella fastidiosa 32]OCA57967.1 hypothetical protein AA93_05530 [Xylella fastidiosa subsp. pauca 11399]OJZ70865.1 hypothetical protein B375_0207565 [Xylella fastidiosa 6c]TNW21842.1 hypothetical protein EIP73_01675 [Xylella fastidiosa subsp. pauca]